MTLDDGFKKAALMNTLANIIDSIYLSRGKSEEKRA
jgi:hypothetical protein